MAAAHDRLVRAAAAAEDPHAALTELEVLLDGAPAYPAWFTAALWLGQAWGRIGERGRAAAWLDRAIAAAPDAAARFRGELERARLDADAGALGAARARLAALTPPDALAADARAELLADLDRRAARSRWRTLAWLALGMLAVGAALALRRRRGGWGAAGRALWPPPLEVAYLIPVAIGVAVVARTGNALAAAAVERILLGAIAIAWLGGAVARGPRPARRWWLVFAGAVVVAAAACAYLAIVDDQLLDLLLETWRSGHDLR